MCEWHGAMHRKDFPLPPAWVHSSPIVWEPLRSKKEERALLFRLRKRCPAEAGKLPTGEGGMPSLP
jgi:hypothetical protein